MSVKAPKAHPCLELFFQRRFLPKASDTWLEMQHCSLLCWPTKRRVELTGYSQKISISTWLPVSLGLLGQRLTGSKLAWAGMLEFSWSDREQHLNYVMCKSNRSYLWLYGTSMYLSKSCFHEFIRFQGWPVFMHCYSKQGSQKIITCCLHKNSAQLCSRANSHFKVRNDHVRL